VLLYSTAAISATVARGDTTTTVPDWAIVRRELWRTNVLRLSLLGEEYRSGLG
jgi:hypothetical protein